MASRGPLARAPGALKGGTLPKMSTLLSQLKGEKNKFSKSLCRKTEGGPFGVARYGMLRGKTGKTFLLQFARPNGAI